MTPLVKRSWAKRFSKSGCVTENSVEPQGAQSSLGDVSTHVAVPNGRVGTRANPGRAHPSPVRRWHHQCHAPVYVTIAEYLLGL